MDKEVKDKVLAMNKKNIIFNNGFLSFMRKHNFCDRGRWG